MADFIDFGGMTTFPGPYDCSGTTLFGWFVEGDHTKIDALCRRVFAGATAGAIDYRPLGHHVMLTFGDIRNVRPVPEPYHSMGVLDETQVAIWVPVARVEERRGELHALSLAFWVPFIWLANPMSFATGREGAGWAKTWGVPTMPAKEGDPPLFALDVFGMNYGPESRPSSHRLITIDRGEPVGDPPRAYEGIVDVARHFGPMLFGDHDDDLPKIHHGISVMRSVWHDAVTAGLPELFLKQSRDAHDGTKADLQVVGLSRATVKALHGGSLEHEHSLVVAPLDTHDLAGQLGVQSQRLGLGFRVEMDFVQEVCDVIWTA